MMQIAIGIFTVDVLRHLSSEEISRIPEQSSNDRLARLSTHILSQQRHVPEVLFLILIQISIGCKMLGINPMRRCQIDFIYLFIFILNINFMDVNL